MSTLSIVVEGPTDAELLRKILPKKDLAGTRFFAAQGRISLSTVARNIVVHEGSPTLVVMDADQARPSAAEEARLHAKAVIQHVSGHVPVDVFAFAPMIEIVFFEAPEFLARILGRKRSEIVQFLDTASPKRALATLLHEAGLNDGASPLLAIDEKAAEALRKGKQLRALIDVIHQLRREMRDPRRLAEEPA
jgi:hypothetical protein